MNAMGSGGDGDWGYNKTESSQSRQEKQLDFSHFWHATEGISSRAGIVGLAGFVLGITTLATSKLVGAARGGGAKGFFRQFGIGIATPLKAIGKRFNPQFANSGNETNKFKTEKFGKWKEKSLNKKLGKLKGNLDVKKIANPQYKKEIKLNKQIDKLINKTPKL